MAVEQIDLQQSQYTAAESMPETATATQTPRKFGEFLVSKAGQASTKLYEAMTAGVDAATNVSNFIEQAQREIFHPLDHYPRWFRDAMNRPMLETSSLGFDHAVRVFGDLREDEVPILITNALGLRSDLGYMPDRLFQIAEETGRPIINISSIGFEGKPINPNQYGDINFASIANSTGDVLDKWLVKEDLDFPAMDLYGESQGGMNALRLAGRNDRMVKFRHVTTVAACGSAPARKPGVLREYARQWGVNEAPEAIRQIGRVAAQEERLVDKLMVPIRYGHTLRIRPEAWPVVGITASDVFRGPLLDIVIDSDHSPDMLFFDNDFTSYPQRWRELVPHANVEERPGSHMTIIDPATGHWAAEKLRQAT